MRTLTLPFWCVKIIRSGQSASSCRLAAAARDRGVQRCRTDSFHTAMLVKVGSRSIAPAIAPIFTPGGMCPAPDETGTRRHLRPSSLCGPSFRRSAAVFGPLSEK